MNDEPVPEATTYITPIYYMTQTSMPPVGFKSAVPESE
jgi:hypothetical protein